MTITIKVRGVPLEVEYEPTLSGDILISEVKLGGAEIMCLIDDHTISTIRDEIIKARRG